MKRGGVINKAEIKKKKKNYFFLIPLLLSLLSCFFLWEAWCENLCEQTSSLHSLASLTQAVVCTDRCTVSLVLCLLMNCVLRVCYGLFVGCQGCWLFLGLLSTACSPWHVVFQTLLPSHLALGFPFFFPSRFWCSFFIYSFFFLGMYGSVCVHASSCHVKRSMTLSSVTEDNIAPNCCFERIRHA